MNELMHRLTRYCAGWVTATTLATGVSWVAIDNLVTTAALSPLAVPVLATSVPTAPDPVVTRPARKATESPKRSTPTRTTRPARKPSAPKTSERKPRSSTPESPPTPTSTPTIKGYSSPGGQIVLELRPTSVELVSAVPAAGYQAETWKTDYWIRIDFVKGERRSSLIASWYQQEPVIQQTEF
jgi:hypothetical protein